MPENIPLISVVGHILDIESEEGYSEDEHRFHHPNFPEYFAAKQLMVLYNQSDTAELFSAMLDISRKEDKKGNIFSV